MDKIKESSIYKEDIESILNQKCEWTDLENKTILITGASGLIGTVLVDMFVFLNLHFSLNLKLILISRHQIKTEYDFIRHIIWDISKPINFDSKIDYVIHAASVCNPSLYSTQPIETITGNVFGTYHLLNNVCSSSKCRFLFLSSSEIYGDDIEKKESGFSEEDFGYLDCNQARSCYNESKRLSETLCAAYASEKKVDYVICRLSRSYGPTLKEEDSKALSQFLHNAVRGKDIVLKSQGNQFYSYIYSADAASSIIFLLLNGKSGEAYNVSDIKSNITLKNLSKLIAVYTGSKVVFDLPSQAEQKGYSKAQRAILDSRKINQLGWSAHFDIESGIRRTVELLKVVFSSKL